MDVAFLARLMLLALLAGGSLAQSPVIIDEPVILPGLPSSPSADLHFDPALDAAPQPGYAFAYGVDDPKSGNAQSHKEERDGDKVRGEYKVLEADGSVRTVTYSVDPKNGFKANVHQSDPALAAPFRAEAKQSRRVDVPADIHSSDIQLDVGVDTPGPSHHSDYFSGSSFSSDFDP